MHRIDTSTAQIDKFGAGKNGFSGGNPQTGELPTALNELFFDSVQEEICAVIEGAGNTLNKGQRNQLITALKKLFLQSGNNLSDISNAITALANLGGAPLDSPTFTGIPKGPTAAAGTNNTQFATTAFAQALIAGLLKSSNNLSEIAAAGPIAQSAAMTNLGVKRQRTYVSAGQSLVANTPTIVTHGLTIDPTECILNIRLKCLTANNGYSVGDYAVAFAPRISAGSSAGMSGSLAAVLSASTAQFNTGGLGISLMTKTSGLVVGVETTATLAQWALEFVIIY